MANNLVIALAILAAGGSTRFGSQKLFFQIEEKPMLQHEIDHVLELMGLFPEIQWNPALITGSDHDKIIGQIQRKDVPFIENLSWKEGIATSLKLAVSFALSEMCEGLLLFLGDMPFLKLPDSRKVVQMAQDRPKAIIRPSFEGSPGFPVYLPKGLFQSALQLEGDQGARQIIQAHHHLLIHIPVDSAASTLDFDHLPDPS